MSAVGRLLPVFDAWQRAYGVLHAGAEGPHEVPDPTLAADIADGEALRRLREALPEGWMAAVKSYGPLVWVVARLDDENWTTTHTFPTVAEAADACRKAIEAQR